MKKFLSLLIVLFWVQGLSGAEFREKRSLKDLEAAFSSGDSKAAAVIGWRYLNGVDTKVDFKKAVEWFDKGIQKGDARSILRKARALEDSKADKKEILKLLKEAAEKGDRLAYYKLGNAYETGSGTGKKLKTAWINYLKGAQKGSISCMLRLNHFLKRGLSVERNVTAADSWLKKAEKAAAGKDFELEGLVSLAIYYFEDEETKDKSYDLLKKAAVFGDIGASLVQAEWLANGKGVAKNEKLASQVIADIRQKGEKRADYVAGIILLSNAENDEEKVKALPLIVKAYKNGVSEAAYSLGNLYMKGIGVKQDFKKAIEWFSNGRKMKDLACINQLGVIYQLGIGVERDFKKALAMFTEAYEQGDSESVVNIGNIYLTGDNRDDKLALKWFTKGALKGSAPAMYNLSLLYLKGRGLKEPSMNKYRFWLKKASDAGSLTATRTQAQMVMKGYAGFKKDEKLAKTLYMRSAAMGDTVSMVNLGLHFMKAKSDDYDPKIAYRWFKKGADKGNSECMRYIGVMYHKGVGFKKDLNTAFEWSKKAADAGNAKAMNYVGYAYVNGEGVLKDEFKGFQWFFRASAMLDKQAMLNIAAMFKNGNAVKKNIYLAKKWFEFSRSNVRGNDEFVKSLTDLYLSGVLEKEGYDTARKMHEMLVKNKKTISYVFLGRIYQQGLGVKVDYKKAIEYFSEGIKNGSGECAYHLAMMYKLGYGFEKSLKNSLTWFKNSMDQGFGGGAREAARIYLTEKKYLDEKLGVTTMKKAANMGDGEAMFLIAEYYLKGLHGLKKDSIRAEVWYENALNAGCLKAEKPLKKLQE